MRVWIISLVLCFLHHQIEGTPTLLQIPNNEAAIFELMKTNPGHEGLSLALQSLRNSRSPTDAYLIVLGLSGAGKSSTIKRLVQGQLPAGSADSIQEYILPVSLPAIGVSNARLHIIDTPGFGESDGREADVRLLATLRKLCRDHSELSTKLPTSILILSRFDDNRASGESSKFVKMLKAFDYIKEGFVPQTGDSNVLFLLTRFMSETKTTTRRPNDRIKFFENIIRNFTHFPAPITVRVGENNGEEKDLQLVNGSFELPNRDRYPENVIKSMIQSATNNRDPMGAKILEHLLGGGSKFESRQVQTINHRLDQINADDVQAIGNHLGGIDLNIESNEVNNALARAYEDLPANLKKSSLNVLQLVQTAFQHAGIKRLDDIPKTTKEIARLLQTIDLNLAAVEILDKGLGLLVPELYTTKFIVGYGYDVLNDQEISTSPFDLDNLQTEPSPLGYKIPSMLACELTEGATDTFDFPNSYLDYVGLRKHEYDMAEDFQDSKFEGQAREGHNINDGSGLTSLTAVRDVWKFKLELKETQRFSNDFQDVVNSLTLFDSGNQESVKEWKSFLNSYGTHIVSSAFGGGSMISTVSADKFRSLITSQAGINDLKSYLLDFQRLRNIPGIDQVTPQYRYQGGEPEHTMSEINKISEPERTSLITDWKSSILTNPVILQTKLSLTPISVYVRKVRPNIADEVNRAIGLLFSGDLVYKRMSKANKPTVPQDPPIVDRRPAVPTQSPFPSTRDQYPIGRPSDGQCQPCPEQITQQCPPPKNCPIAPPTPQNTHTSCPSVIAQVKSNSGRRSKPLDVTLNLVGQSYDLLRDTVMETSPFLLTPQLILKWKENYSGDREIEVDRANSEDCPSTTFEQFATRKEYMTHRFLKLDRTTSYAVTLNNEIFRFNSSRVKPGYNVVQTSNPLAEITRLEEAKIFKISLYFPYGTSPNFNPAFRAAVLALPDTTVSDINRESCEFKNAWVKFYETYGTHVVTSAFVGRSVTTTVLGKPTGLNSQFPVNSTIDCSIVKKPQDNFASAWLQSDMKLTMINNYISKINSALTLAAQDAIFAWYDGRLVPCTN